MKKENLNQVDKDITSARFAEGYENPYGYVDDEFEGFSSRKDMIFDSLQRYWDNCKTMMISSLNHLRSPVTIIVIILLIATYILLGVAGEIGFSFLNKNTVQEIQTNLDIVVNALLGYFFGPVTCAISVALCCIVRIIANRTVFFIGYVIGATVAGFLHGWILYRHKTMWFGTRFRGFFSDLLAKVFTTRLVVSVFVNIILMAIIYKIFINYPVYEYLMHYAKSKVELASFQEFAVVFIAGLVAETAIIFIALAVINFIVMKAFPSQFEQPTLIIDKNGTIINPEEDME